ncbi:DUF5592 family protein [Clostridium perfringens]|uniref:DUF5592 family protein n=1 Tax=Clostridium perfringens TaxID=1502 RepID=UPI000D71424E|nr:DUF5592 family protein [Clostridium perfringens]MBO3392307.1 hypothetical protein [Clostridium perfringens]MBO3399441.1 hypothetical protein [Clostridium perfringens]MBO3408387.1 hypothetical protein [Clostridium perfringens]MBO3424446.1 hypothetical protein [Clostridium perfringens]MDM0719896.1 DUF5592 family protein [Clostridium perfringens]
MYNIPKEISSETKLSNKFYFFDLAMTLLSLMIAFSLQSLVYPPLLIPFYIFVAGSTIYLVNKSIVNPKKRIYQSIYLDLCRDRTTYIAE